MQNTGYLRWIMRTLSAVTAMMIIAAPSYAQLARHSDLSAPTRTILESSDPLIYDALTYAIDNKLTHYELKAMCASFLEAESPYRTQTLRLLNGLSCRDFVEQRIEPVRAEYKQALALTR